MKETSSAWSGIYLADGEYSRDTVGFKECLVVEHIFATKPEGWTVEDL